MTQNDPTDSDVLLCFQKASKQIETARGRLQEASKYNTELKRMKYGSIALVNQIVTISKLRIYNPLYKEDSLSGISLSDTSLDKIDKAIIDLLTHNKLKEKM